MKGTNEIDINALRVKRKQIAAKLKIIAIAHHRNGVAGEPFDIVLFRERGAGGDRKIAILFEQRGQCAVLDVVKVAAGDIAFGSNSWRGDDYEPALRDAIETVNPNGVRP